MAPLYNAPFGRGYKIVLPPNDNSFKLLVDDFCFKNHHDANRLAWIGRQSEMIAVAFKESWQPRLPNIPTMLKAQPSGDETANVGIEHGVIHGDDIEDQDAILEFTTLMDTKPEELIATPRQPHCTSQVNRPFVPVHNNRRNTNGANGVNESDVMVTHTEVSPTNLLPGTDKLVECLTGKEQPRGQAWQINSRGHLIVPESLSTHITGPKSASLNPGKEESLLPLQSAAVARLVAENRQLEAFRQALRFALQDASTHTNGVKFTAEAGLHDCTPGISYPIIDIFMGQWREDTELQCYLAYYLLRGMLKRYGDLPFPDRVDIREFGSQRGRLLVPYGAGREEIDGEGRCVRRKIVDEMRLEGRFIGKGSKRL
ncbi:hypothetical protein F5Y12DRAFT_792907 [Xylaria sp. FL1777]|nr:hypothetical protein F5Y12DRAFT_792907 [Xylaria sp. FL1777]